MRQLILLRQFYSELEIQIDHFQELSGISCLFGCGDCCTHFEPYISLLEAVPIADYLQRNYARWRDFHYFPRTKTDLLCPFYDAYTPLHCSIHTIRPLICRLFAFSARRVRGVAEYAPCRLIERHLPTRVALAGRLLAEGLPLPIYSDVHPRMRSIDFALATDLHPLTDSVELALRHWQEIGNGQPLPLPDSRHALALPFSTMVRDHIHGRR